MWRDFFSALALMMVLEGVMPFLNPRGLKQTLEMLARADDRLLRFIGLASMVIGLLILYLVR